MFSRACPDSCRRMLVFWLLPAALAGACSLAWGPSASDWPPNSARQD